MNNPPFAAYKVKGTEDLLIIARDFGNAEEIYKRIMKESGLDMAGKVVKIEFVDYVANHPFHGWSTPMDYEWMARIELSPKENEEANEQFYE